MSEGALIGALIGAVIGGIIGVIMFSSQRKTQKIFNLKKGMTYNEAVAILGEPTNKNHTGQGLTCWWYTQKDGKNFKVVAFFKNNLMV